MNVLLISPDTTENPFGGMGVQMAGLQKADSPINFKFYYCSGGVFNEQDSIKTVNIDGTPCHMQAPYDDKIFTVNNLYSQLLSIPEISKLKDIDIVNSFDASTGILGAAIAKALGVPHVFTLQLSNIFLLRDIFGFKGLDYFKRLEIKCIQHAHAVVHGSMEYAREFYHFNKNVYTLRCGIDFDYWQKAGCALGYSNLEEKTLPGRKNAKKLCYIGRIAGMKNIHGLMNAKLPDNVDLYFIGHDRAGNQFLYEQFKDFVKNNIVTLEALASDNILLSSFKSGMGEYLNEDVAINCGTTPEKISKAILKWSKMSKKQVNDQIKRGHKFLKPFTWENSAAVLHEVYKRTIEQYNLLKEKDLEVVPSALRYNALTKFLNSK
jgi:glycosyltransferase involved in cell wall biosynthesis